MEFILPDIISRGGWMMIPILLCSMAALGFFLERLYKLRTSRVMPKEFFISADGLIRKARYQEALELCKTKSSAAARMYQAALKIPDGTRSEIKEVLEEAGRREAADLNRFLSVLSTTASISPLLGLLGTVSGMIKTFNIISYHGVGNPGTLAAGISEALLTTAAGLSVAIPTLIAYRITAGRADRLTAALEHKAVQLLDMLKTAKVGE